MNKLFKISKLIFSLSKIMLVLFIRPNKLFTSFKINRYYLIGKNRVLYNLLF